LCSCRTFQVVLNLLSDAKFQEIWCNVYITVIYFCKTMSWPSSVHITSTNWCTERCQKCGYFFRRHFAPRFVVNVLCYLFRVISLLIQNESVELTDDVKRSPEVLCCLLFFFFLTIFIAFEMAPKCIELSLLKVALNPIK
jgi:hypothetical protein